MGETQIHDLWKLRDPPKTIGERAAMDLLETTWTPSGRDRDDSDRGCFVTRLRCTELRTSPPGGWGAMEHADRVAEAAWRVLADAIDAAIASAGGPEMETAPPDRR